MILAHHGTAEAIALFVPALAIAGVVAGAVILDRKRGTTDEDPTQTEQKPPGQDETSGGLLAETPDHPITGPPGRD